jgi:hypothetical protein
VDVDVFSPFLEEYICVKASPLLPAGMLVTVDIASDTVFVHHRWWHVKRGKAKGWGRGKGKHRGWR